MKKLTNLKEKIESLFPDLIYIGEEGRNVIVRDKYGELKVRKDVILKGKHPSSRSAVDKNQYYKNKLLDVHPEIFNQIEIVSDIKGTKEPIICKTKWGLTKTTYDQLLQGCIPIYINSAVDKNEFIRNKLLDIYKDYDYDFKVIDEDYSYLICPIHGKIPIKNELLLRGRQCPKCIEYVGSNILYLLQLSNQYENFYKIGISRESYKSICRYNSYTSIGYKIESIYEIYFNNEQPARELESKVKGYIKSDLYQPKIWNPNKSTETFSKKSLLDVISIIEDFMENNRNSIISIKSNECYK